MIGKGGYDGACDAAYETTGASAIVLVVVNGERGHGVSVKCSQEWLKEVPEVLRLIAEALENDLNTMKGNLQ